MRPTVERVDPEHFRSKEKYLLYLRHVFAYEFVKGGLKGDERVLEIGFGEGYGSEMLADAAQVVAAIDVEASLVDEAGLRHRHQNLRFSAYDGRKIPFDDDSFEAVVSFQVIEHVEDDAGFVREAARVLKPGGMAWFTTPNRKHRVSPGEPLWNEFHVREYLVEEFREVLSSVFDEVDAFGIRGTDEIQAVEHARVRRGLSLRKLIPEPVKGWFDGDVRRRFSTADFRVERTHVEEGLDLLGVCRKV